MAEKECIEREKAFNAILKLVPKVDDDGYCWVIRGDAARAIDSIPAADARPVVRGRWERMPDNDVFGDVHCKCSACGEDWWQGPGWFRKANFCPNCGADMRGES